MHIDILKSNVVPADHLDLAGRELRIQAREIVIEDRLNAMYILTLTDLQVELDPR